MAWTAELPSSQAALLRRISKIVHSDRSLEEMLGEVIGITAQATQCDACLVYLVEPETHNLVLRASQLPHSAEVGVLHLEMGEGITGWVAEQGSVAAIPEKAFQDPRFKRFSALVEDNYEALLSAPLIASGKTIGVINVHHRQPHVYSPEEIALVTFVGEQIGGALEKARLREEKTRLQEEALEAKRQLETRKVVERAKGILQRRAGLSEEEAYLRLRHESRRTRRPMKEIAEAIVLAEEMQRRGETPSPEA